MHVRELGAGEDERGGAVDGRGQRGRLAPFQGRAERGGERCGQRVGEQGGAAAAGEAGIERVVLGDVELPDDRWRAGRLGDRERDDVAVQCAVQYGAGDVAVRSRGEQLSGLDGPEPVPVEHAHDPDRLRAALGPPAQRGAELPGRRRARRRRRTGHGGHAEQGSRARSRPVARTAARPVALRTGPRRDGQESASDTAAGSAATRSRASNRIAARAGRRRTPRTEGPPQRPG